MVRGKLRWEECKKNNHWERQHDLQDLSRERFEKRMDNPTVSQQL